MARRKRDVLGAVMPKAKARLRTIKRYIKRGDDKDKTWVIKDGHLQRV